ncbi:heterokaryon incompatibility protein-domain-containing protein [Rhexocercosporidium sp. MPI-PUGE-AT-0058]|nr:heterokaryon incompatibility protein-domain-containing protein [Rhexocercosporidium sp. MPI-PUGE-AT-0058]
MWLLDTSTLALRSFMGDDVPPYAILSHTWGAEEVSLQDILSLQNPVNQTFDFRGARAQSLVLAIKDRAGYVKIERCCAQALTDGYKYAWVDTCCIDKTNSSELSEAINSMFRWYQNAAACYAFLDDIKPGSDLDRLGDSRWFARGWTLQELIAPSSVVFFDRSWTMIGSRATLTDVIGRRTGIPSDVLVDYQQTLGHYSLAQTMSWASKRETTRAEDRAYSLLGLFKVSMPMLYGEGGSRAFLRLQLEIIKSSVDHSIFAWIGEGDDQRLDGPFARCPDNFALCGDIIVDPLADNLTYEMTNLGLRIKLYISARLNIVGASDVAGWASLNCLHSGDESAVGIWLTGFPSKSQHTPIKQLMRTKSASIHPGAEDLVLALTEVYFIDPSVEIMGGFGSLSSQSSLQPDRICRIHAWPIIQSGWSLEKVKNWAVVDIGPSVDLSLIDSKPGILFNVPGKCYEPATFLFSDRSKDRRLAIHVSLKSDKCSWCITGPIRTSGVEERDIRELELLNSIDVAEYGEERSQRSSLLANRFTFRATRVIISGKHGFDLKLDLKGDLSPR